MALWRSVANLASAWLAEAISSVEAYGILVSELCQKNNVDYYYGPNTLTYVGCVLFE